MDQRLSEQRLLEQIDARRRGADNVRDPVLSDLADAVARGDERALRMLSQVEAADAAISAALKDVPVPRDLAERLLVALKAAEHGEPVDTAALRRSGIPEVRAAQMAIAGEYPAAPAGVEPSCRTKPVGRRTWLGWSIAVATAAAAVALFGLLYPWAPPWITSDEIAQHVNVMYDSEIGLIEADAWTPGAPVSEPPVSAITLPPTQRWRELTLGRYPATAYDLSGPGAPKRATLLVIDRRVRGLDYRPPTVPASTHGRCVGVWQSDTQVFALIVEGTVDEYQQLIEPQAIA